MPSREDVFKYAGAFAAVLAAVAAVSIIVAAVDWRRRGEWELVTHNLGDDASAVWALLALLLAVGVAAAVIAARRGAGPGDEALDNFFCALEIGLLLAGFASALLLFLGGIRLFIVVTDAESLWWMFVLSMALAILSGAKSGALRRWLSRDGAAADDV